MEQMKTAAPLVASAMLALSILVGKLRLPLGPLGIESSPILDVRLLALILTIALLAPSIRQFDYRRLLTPALWALMAFVAYMVGRSFLSPSETGLGKQLDMIYLAAQAVMTCFVMARASTRVAFGLAIVAFAAAYLFANLADKAIHFTGPAQNVGLGWGPIGTAVTFNRLMFLGACVSFIFAFSPTRWRWAFLILGALFLYGGLASLQKAAAAFYMVSLAIAFGVMAASKAWRMAVLTGVAVAAAAVAFVATSGGDFASRVEQAVSDKQVVGATMATPLEVEPSDLGEDFRQLPQHGITHEVATQPTQFSVQTDYCIFQRNPEKDALEIACRDRMVVDRTSRPVLFLEAFRGFSSAPVFGNGMGNYEVFLINEEHLRPDRYYYPHNLLLEVAFEGGVVGVALLGISLLAGWYLAAKTTKPLPVSAFGWAFIAFMLCSSMFAGDIYDTRLLWLTTLSLIGYALSGEGKVVPEHSVRASRSVKRSGRGVEEGQAHVAG